MDRVRLGRALGYGARHAAKTLQQVAEAATTPAPEQAGNRGRDAAASAAAAPRARARRVPDVARVKGAGRSMWGPLAAFSSALWLRVTGLFFALVAWAMAAGAWRLRNAVHGGASGSVGGVEARHFWMFAGFGLLFAYFAVSSFVRASARERRGLQG